jgi:hypothetical protein
MGLRPTQGNEKRLGPASTLYGTVTFSLSSRPERSGAEGPAVPQTFRGNAKFQPQTKLSSRLPRRAVGPERKRNGEIRSFFFGVRCGRARFVSVPSLQPCQAQSAY